jgi:Protein of unknown function (DUF3485)
MPKTVATVPNPAVEKAGKLEFPVWRSVVVLLLVGLALLLCLLFQDVNTQSEAGAVMNLPSSVGKFLGFDEDVTPAERVILPPDTEFAKKRYVGFGSSDVTTEIVLSGAQRQSIHRPQVCLVGQGWTIQKEETQTAQLADGKAQKVRILTLSRTENGVPVIGYFVYWFIGKDKTTDSHFERIFLTSWDRIVHRVNHRWAYVIVSGILPPGEKVTEGAQQQLQRNLLAFTRDIIPLIQKPQVNAGS